MALKTFLDFNNDFNLLACAIYQQNVDVGWWDEPLPLDVKQVKLMLVITEIAEATEGERKNLMDDHLPHRRMGEVELADALIRLLDLALHYAKELEDFREEFAKMSSFANEIRYIADSLEPKREEAEKALDIAEKVFSLIDKKFTD